MTPLEELYRRHGPMVLRRCRRLLRDPEEAVDAMQDTFVEVLRRIDDLDQVANPTGLLFTAATRVCLNRLRTHKRRPGDGASEDDALLEQIASSSGGEQAEARSMLDRILGREPESTQVIAVLHLLDGLTLEEVAAEVGMSVSGVRKRLRTLRARLPQLEAA